MPHTKPASAVQSTSSVRKTQDKSPASGRKAIDVLYITAGMLNDGGIKSCERSCEDCQLKMKLLAMDELPGAGLAEKAAALMQRLQAMKAAGEIDLATQIKFDGHGEMEGGKLILSGDKGSGQIDDGVVFLRDIRASLGSAPDQAWEGTIHFETCYAGGVREDLKNHPGRTLLYAGKQSMLSPHGWATFDQVLRTWSAEARADEAPKREQVKRMFQTAREHTGENIAMCGSGEVLTHKAIDFNVNGRPDSNNFLPLMAAKLHHGTAQSVKKLLAHDPQRVLALSPKDELAFMELAIRNEADHGEQDTVEKIRHLLDAGHAVNGHCTHDANPIVIAMDAGSRAAAEFLLQRGANRWERTPQGYLAWHFAADDVRHLLIGDADQPVALPPAYPEAGNFPNHEACARGDLHALESMSFADLNEKDVHGNTPLGVALLHGKASVIANLAPRLVQLNVRLHTGETLLGHAIRQGQFAAVQLLLKYGADSVWAEKRSMPLLTCAMHAIHAGRANSNLLKLVLGTEAGKASLANDLPVHYALLLGNTNLARQLIKLGADPEATDGKGRSAYDLVTDRSALKKLKAAHRQQATT